MVKWLKKKYESPIDAERVFFPKASVGTQTNLSTNRSIGSQTDLSSRSIGSQTDLSSRSIGSQTDLSTSNSIASQTDLSSRSIITSQSAHFSDLSYSQSASDDVIYMPNASEQSSISTLSQTFSAHCKKSLQLDVPVDFLAYAGTAMARLKENGQANVVYNLVKGVGKDRPDSSNSRFPVSRMPMGLIEYATNFYIAENINQVSVTLYFFIYAAYCELIPTQVPPCPEDYQSWLQTMYSQFGQKWAKLHHGPMWSIASTYHSTHLHERSTMKVIAHYCE